MASRPAPPQQVRSRKSLRRMLDAAEVVLDKHGLDGATLRRIAAHAGLAPATVYRRFPDKDALMGAVFSRASERNAEELAKPLDREQIRKMGIRNFSRQWIRAMIQGYRTRTGLVRASVLYARQHQRAAFVRRQQELEVRGFRRLASLFLLWRGEIRHPHPERAVAYAMVMVALALRELILFGQAHLFAKLVPVSDEHLEKELPRVFLGYLGVKAD